MWKKALALLALGAVAAQPVAAAPGCITPDQMGQVVTVLMPTAMDALTNRCSAVLPGHAFLPTRGHALAASFRPAADAAWPDAQRALAATGDSTIAMLAGSKEGLQGTVGGIITSQAAKLKPADCTTADALAELLAPLPAPSYGKLFALALHLSKKADLGPIRICRAPQP